MNEHPLVGTWHSPEWSDVEVTIKQLETTLQVEAVDLEDEETLQIRNTSWDENSISFDLYTPSTDHACRHVITNKGKGKATFEITWSEEWVLKK